MGGWLWGAPHELIVGGCRLAGLGWCCGLVVQRRIRRWWTRPGRHRGSGCDGRAGRGRPGSWNQAVVLANECDGRLLHPNLLIGPHQAPLAVRHL